jgi:hypothetical protein
LLLEHTVALADETQAGNQNGLVYAEGTSLWRGHTENYLPAVATVPHGRAGKIIPVRISEECPGYVLARPVD